MATREELAWAAGFFDGEGCFGNSPAAENKQGIRRRYLRASLSQKYPALVHQFHEIVGVGTIHFSPARPTSSQAYIWRTTSKNAFSVANALWPWLGEQKKADFKRGLRGVRDARLLASTTLPRKRVCGAADCDTAFAPDIRHPDSAYCSNRCYQRIHARGKRGPAPPKHCSGCGCPVDHRTRGCRRCMTRHWQRKSKAAQRG